jgi:hypothetical protein
MCIPILPLIGAAVSAVGTIASAQAQSASYKAQAKYADRQAQMAGQKGAYDAAQLGRQNDRRLGEMRSQYLNSGIALDGSAVDVLTDSATQASLDEQAIKYSAQVQSDNYRFQSSLARQNASSAMTGGYLSALATGINGFTQISSQNQQRTMISNPYAQYPAGKGLW